MSAAPADEVLHRTGVLIGGLFRVEAVIGHGGMAAVYRVQDERSGRKLALKQLFSRARAGAALITTQFEREYHTLCQLAHPRIVSVYDYGVDNGLPFYTMELLDGADLSARRKEPWREVCSLLCDVASALAIIHSRRFVYRDLSLRNVHRTDDGRAKLIDLGALAPMGRVKAIIGTPPFVSPELLELQALDARSDLYALGVLAYYLLTGYYPYHSRNLSQLRALWRSPPYPPRWYQSELPPALDELVMQLIELDRTARPTSAGEVMERLSGIAGLSLRELPAVGQAYLAMPMLVGRQPLLDEIRGRLAQTQQGRGGSVLIEGAPGMGRSRLLDACVLEAKLLGTVVLRVDAADGGDDYGVIRALCTQLLQQLPELCETAAAPRAALLAHVMPELALGAEPPDPPPSRPALQGAFCDFFVSLARGKPLVIAVDDLDAVDEASSAVLGALAHGATMVSLCVLLTAQRDAAGPALALVRKIATPIALQPLSGIQTEALLRSVFGDVAHVTGLSERIHRVSEGNPQWTMTIAEQLVERARARYEAGSWALPAELEPGVLAQYLGNALRSRIAALTPDARQLAEALSFTNPALLSVGEYRLLTQHGDAGRVYEALDQLVAQRILRTEGERYLFTQESLIGLLRGNPPPEYARALHARIAQALQHGEHPLQLAYHLMHAGEERAALEQLLPLAMDRKPSALATFQIELIERAVATAERLQLPLQQQLGLRKWLVSLCAREGFAQAHSHGLALVSHYERESGLADYQALSGEMPHAERLARALEDATARYHAAEPDKRGFAPPQAMAHLAEVCAALVAVAAISEDLSLLEGLPSLVPLCETSPQLGVVRLLIEQQTSVLAGSHAGVTERAHEILRRLERPDRSGFSAEFTTRIRFSVVYLLGLFAAATGRADAREWVAELQRTPGHRENAWRVRMVYELMHGNQEAATVCQRRAELVNLQDSGHAMFPGTTIKIELLAAIYADDLMTVKRLSERLESLTARYPGWRTSLSLARSHYRRLQGDLRGALQALQPGLEAAKPGRHSDWSMLVSTEVALLAALGRADEATGTGLQHVATSLQHGLWHGYANLLRCVAEAAQRAGRIHDARELLDRSLNLLRTFAARGLLLGLVQEARARVAIAMHDQPGLQLYFDACAAELKGRRDGALNRIRERLAQEAGAAGLALVTQRQAPAVQRRPRLHTIAEAG